MGATASLPPLRGCILQLAFGHQRDYVVLSNAKRCVSAVGAALVGSSRALSGPASTSPRGLVGRRGSSTSAVWPAPRRRRSARTEAGGCRNLVSAGLAGDSDARQACGPVRAPRAEHCIGTPSWPALVRTAAPGPASSPNPPHLSSTLAQPAAAAGLRSLDGPTPGRRPLRCTGPRSFASKAAPASRSTPTPRADGGLHHATSTTDSALNPTQRGFPPHPRRPTSKQLEATETARHLAMVQPQAGDSERAVTATVVVNGEKGRAPSPSPLNHATHTAEGAEPWK